MDLKQRYLDYISAINSGRPLDNFVQDRVQHNNSGPMSVTQYSKNITEAQADMPGLFFDIAALVVESDNGDRGERGDGNVAVRIKLSFDAEAGMKEVFNEHVFYRFEEGKIARVWSLLDGAGLEWSNKRKAAA